MTRQTTSFLQASYFVENTLDAGNHLCLFNSIVDAILRHNLAAAGNPMVETSCDRLSGL